MKSDFFKYIFYVILVILIFLAIYFIYKDENNKTIAQEENEEAIKIIDEINIGILGYDTINPILSKNRNIQYISNLLFDSLLEITKDFKIKNKLAKEFSKINSTTYIIKLREDIYFHNNINLTAKDVISTINYLKRDNVNSIYKPNVKDIENVEQIDDYTIKIFLKNEVLFFEYNMCFPILLNSFINQIEMDDNIVGTGEYKIEKIEENEIKLVKANKDEESKIKRINIILEENAKKLYNDFEKGKSDYIVTESVDYEEYLGSMGYNVEQIPNREFDYLVLNNQNNILKSKEIRKALNMLINKNSINYNCFNNKYTICNSPLYYGSYLENAKSENNYNTNLAKSFLISNGWVQKKNKWINKNKVLSFNLVVNKENRKRVLVAQYIKEQLESIGIVVNLINANNYVYNSYLKNKNYDMILTGNIISNSPNLEIYFNENNLSNFKNEKMQEILKKINNIEDDEMLKEMYSQINKIYLEEIPFISLYANKLFILTNTKLKGDMSCNWYNLFYNIDKWYKVE